MIPNSEFLTGKIYWTKGYEAGELAERERIIKILREEMPLVMQRQYVRLIQETEDVR